MRQSLRITDGPVGRNLFWFTVPIILTGLLQFCYNMADVIVVGRFAGKEALAAVGSTGSLSNLFINLFIGLSAGASVCAAQYLGAGNKDALDKAVHTAMGIALFGGVLIAVVGVLFCRNLLIMMDVPANILDETELYMTIIFLGMPANLVYNFGAGILRATGDSKRPLIFLTVSGILNVALNLVLVIVFHLGAAGVGIATIVAQALSAVLVLYFLANKTQEIRFSFRKIRFSGKYMRKIFQIGIPAGIQGTVFSISNVLVQTAVNGFGDAVVAGNAAAGNIGDIVYIVMNAVHQTMITFVGQNVGAGNIKRVKKIILTGCLQVTIIGIFFSIILGAFGRPLLTLYVPGEEEVIAYGITRLWYLLPLYFTCGLMDVLVGAQRGMGTSLVPMFASILGVCGIRIGWILVVFASVHTLESLYLSYPVSWIVTAIIQAILCCWVYKKTKEQSN
ncbi:MAG: MATE family efflux transporter [Clostridia bacterium]|nr:MATE family efflux transporter [Clostridia bacterium]